MARALEACGQISGPYIAVSDAPRVEKTNQVRREVHKKIMKKRIAAGLIMAGLLSAPAAPAFANNGVKACAHDEVFDEKLKICVKINP